MIFLEKKYTQRRGSLLLKRFDVVLLDADETIFDFKRASSAMSLLPKD